MKNKGNSHTQVLFSVPLFEFNIVIYLIVLKNVIKIQKKKDEMYGNIARWCLRCWKFEGEMATSLDGVCDVGSSKVRWRPFSQDDQIIHFLSEMKDKSSY